MIWEPGWPNWQTNSKFVLQFKIKPRIPCKYARYPCVLLPTSIAFTLPKSNSVLNYLRKDFISILIHAALYALIFAFMMLLRFMYWYLLPDFNLYRFLIVLLYIYSDFTTRKLKTDGKPTNFCLRTCWCNHSVVWFVILAIAYDPLAQDKSLLHLTSINCFVKQTAFQVVVVNSHRSLKS